jgi:hypothetical protein
MFPGPHAARLQITAGATLLHRSKLVEWSRSAGRFLSVSDDAFEYSARNDIDPAFGRLICWMTFSSGVEFLGKGLCIEHGIDFWNALKPASTCDIPTYPISAWLAATKGRPKIRRTPSYGTIGSLTWQVKGSPSAIERLAAKCKATPDQARIVLGTFTLLGTAIRNRDAHAYVPNVRAAHHWLVRDLFLDAIHLLVTWIPNGGAHRLQQWLDEAEDFVQSLPPGG